MESNNEFKTLILTETDSREMGGRIQRGMGGPPPALHPPLLPTTFCQGVFFEKLIKISDNGFFLSISLSNA